MRDFCHGHGVSPGTASGRDRGNRGQQVDECGPAVDDSVAAVHEVFVLVELAGFDDLQTCDRPTACR